MSWVQALICAAIVALVWAHASWKRRRVQFAEVGGPLLLKTARDETKPFQERRHAMRLFSSGCSWYRLETMTEEQLLPKGGDEDAEAEVYSGDSDPWGRAPTHSTPRGRSDA